MEHLLDAIGDSQRAYKGNVDAQIDCQRRAAVAMMNSSFGGAIDKELNLLQLLGLEVTCKAKRETLSLLGTFILVRTVAYASHL